MSEAEWGEETELPEPKKGIPKWIWACGAGCLLMVIVAALGGFLLFQAFGDMMDQDAQWAKLGAVIEVQEEQPEDVMIIGMSGAMSLVPGIDKAWQIHDQRFGRSTPVQTQIFVSTGEGREELLEAFFSEEENDVGGVLGDMGIHGFELGTVQIQGREYRCARFQSFPPKKEEAAAVGEAAEPAGAGSEEGSEGETEDETEDEEEGKEGGFFDEVGRAMRQTAMRIELLNDGETLIVAEVRKSATMEPVTQEDIDKVFDYFLLGSGD